jgi:hypothetical protein
VYRDTIIIIIIMSVLINVLAQNINGNCKGSTDEKYNRVIKRNK